MTRALCADHPRLPPATWDHEIDGEDELAQAARHQLAGEVCDACPLRRPCLEQGRAGYSGGVRGGHPFPDRVLDHRPDDRLATYRDGARQRPACGTPGGRKAHRDRQEDVCDDCALAYRVANRDRMAAKRAADRIAS